MGQDSHARFAGALDWVFRGYQGHPFSIRLWYGWSWCSSPGVAPACTLAPARPKALRSLVLEGSQIALGEAFIHKELEMEGDLFSAFEIAGHVLASPARDHVPYLAPLYRRMRRRLSPG